MEQSNDKRVISTVLRLWITLWGFIKWIAVSLLVGISVGSVGCLFYYAVTGASLLFSQNSYLLYFLPLGGLAIVGIYHLANVPEPKGTDLILTSIQTEGTEPPARMAPLIFISTAITHLFGGSSGREGAALQMGGSLGNLLGNLLSFDEKSKNILIMCGMSAAFTALFGTPLAATIFAMELISVGVMYYAALVPCTVSSVVAFTMAKVWGIRPEVFHIMQSPDLDLANMLRVMLLSMLCAAISAVLCFTLQHAGESYKKLLKNPYIRVFIGGIVVICLTLLVQTRTYLGLGIGSIERAVNDGIAKPEDFVLKLLFTAATLGAGYKGGEIVPSFFVGATFGCVVGELIGLPPSFAAALGLVAVFCGVTNCPMTALVLSFELFGFDSPILFLLAIAVSYMLSGYYSLYSTQRILYDKLRPQYINRKTH